MTCGGSFSFGKFHIGAAAGAGAGGATPGAAWLLISGRACGCTRCVASCVAAASSSGALPAPLGTVGTVAPAGVAGVAGVAAGAPPVNIAVLFWCAVHSANSAG